MLELIISIVAVMEAHVEPFFIPKGNSGGEIKLISLESPVDSVVETVLFPVVGSIGPFLKFYLSPFPFFLLRMA